MKTIFYALMVCLLVSCGTSKKAAAPVADAQREYYKLEMYHCRNNDQIALVENYVRAALMPALRSYGVRNIGVFKPVDNDTATDKKLIVLTPYHSLEHLEKTVRGLRKNVTLEQAAPAYVNAPYNSPPFDRIETSIIEAFDDMKAMALPKLTGPKAQRIYELRSYEGPTEKLYATKVHMFNQGGEITLFNRLNFNAVFYGNTIAGARMPNLVYMTTFENRADRDAHWKTFGDDAEWKTLSAKPMYQHNVSRNVTILMTPTEYSDY